MWLEFCLLQAVLPWELNLATESFGQQGAVNFQMSSCHCLKVICI